MADTVDYGVRIAQLHARINQLAGERATTHDLLVEIQLYLNRANPNVADALALITKCLELTDYD